MPSRTRAHRSALIQEITGTNSEVEAQSSKVKSLRTAMDSKVADTARAATILEEFVLVVPRTLAVRETHRRDASAGSVFIAPHSVDNVNMLHESFDKFLHVCLAMETDQSLEIARRHTPTFETKLDHGLCPCRSNCTMTLALLGTFVC